MNGAAQLVWSRQKRNEKRQEGKILKWEKMNWDKRGNELQNERQINEVDS